MGFKRFHQIPETWLKKVTSILNPGFKTAAAVSVAVTILGIGLRYLGWLQPLELKVYDGMVRLRPDQAIDPRLLIVAVTEEDIRALQRSTPSDKTLADVLAILQSYDPQAIGLDLYRDVPQEPGNQELQKQLQDPNVIVITKLETPDEIGVAPPPNVPADRVGFNDFPLDTDGVVRRNLLFGSTETATYYSFSLLLALNYLANQGVFPTASQVNSDFMQLGDAVFIPLSSNSGAYQRVDALGYQILLNYRSRHVARQVTLSEVLRRDIDPAWVQGNIVLIGTTAESGKDLFFTPYSAAEDTRPKMAGVEIHAQSLSQILDAASGERPLMRFWPEWIEGVWILGWVVIGSTLAWRIHNPLGIGIASTVLLVLIVGSGVVLLMQHTWIPVVAPALATLIATGTVVAHRANQAHQQQKMVMTLLGQNTSPEIAEALWNSRDRLIQSGKLPGQRLVATMLFTDIKGFSAISEQMPPEELLEWLNEYLEEMTEAIQSHQGIVNKFTGDGLLAIFGVPMPRLESREVEQDAYHAIACALEMGTRLNQLNQNWQERGLRAIQMRVGIFTGPAVVGSLGGKDRLEYGVIGDSVNTASRLESCVKERQIDTCRILIALDTLVHVEGCFIVESWGPMALKGKQELVEVYRVIDHAPASGGEGVPLRKVQC